MLNKRNVELKNEINENEIEKLEGKIANLTNKLSEKELIVQDQKEKIDDLQMKIDNLNEDLTAKIKDIKAQYDNVYSASKQNEENFNKLYEDKTNNMKEDIQSNKYQLEKKLVYSKNLINNINNENGILNNAYESDSQIKDNEINILKDNFEKINNMVLEERQGKIFEFENDEEEKENNNFIRFNKKYGTDYKKSKIFPPKNYDFFQDIM